MTDRDNLPLPNPLPVVSGQLTFDDVYDTQFSFVWRSVLSRGVARAAVDDVVQEVFMVVHRKLATFEGRSSMRTWLWTIVRRVVRDYLQKHGNAPTGEPLVDDHASTDRGPAELLDQKDAAALLDKLLARMSDPQREVFVMYELEEMTAVEIAEALAINENTVRTRLRAARQIFSSGVVSQRAGQMWGGYGRSNES
ncbi:MAG TPA: sigma-70 family RNA polymerase sigma factor [Polyangia bacterium]